MMRVLEVHSREAELCAATFLRLRGCRSCDELRRMRRGRTNRDAVEEGDLPDSWPARDRLHLNEFDSVL